MKVLGSIAGALACAWLMVSCGGGVETPAMHDQQASPGVVVGEPAPGTTPVSTELFARAARAEACAGLRNRLFLIDGKRVFWDRAGNCADNSYAQRLYGATPDALLCSAADSIAGPRVACSDESARVMFDTIRANLDRADLGLGRDHKVEPLAVVPAGPGQLVLRELERSTRSLVTQPRNVVVRDAAAFTALWAEHSAERIAAPQVDFSRSMVIAVFTGTRPNGCYSTEITGVFRADGKLTVQRTDWEPGSGAICTMALVNPAHMVVVEHSDDAVEFSAQARLLN